MADDDNTPPPPAATPHYPLRSQGSISPSSLPHSTPRRSVLPNHNSDRLAGTLPPIMDSDSTTTRADAVTDVENTEDTPLPPTDFPDIDYRYDHDSMFNTPASNRYGVYMNDDAMDDIFDAPAEETKVDAAGLDIFPEDKSTEGLATADPSTPPPDQLPPSDEHSSLSTGISTDSVKQLALLITESSAKTAESSAKTEARMDLLMQTMTQIQRVMDTDFQQIKLAQQTFQTDLESLRSDIADNCAAVSSNKGNISATTSKVDKLKAQVEESVVTLQHDVKKVKEFANPRVLKTWMATELPLLLHAEPQLLDAAARDSLVRKSDVVTSMVSDAINANLAPVCQKAVDDSILDLRQQCKQTMHTVDSHIKGMINDPSDTGFKSQVRTYLDNLIASSCPVDLNNCSKDIQEVQESVDRLRQDGMTNLTTSVEAVHRITDSKLAALDSHLSERILRLVDVRIAAAAVRSDDATDDANTSTAPSDDSPPLEGFHSHRNFPRESTTPSGPTTPGKTSMFTPDMATESTVQAMSPSDRKKHYMAHHYHKDLHRHLSSLGMLTSFEVYDKIANVKALILENWSVAGRIGPIRKYMLNSDSFDPLVDVQPSSVLAFYDDLHTKAAFYLIGLTPFDAINLTFPVYGLFLPGLGRDKYHLMAASLFAILQKHLPSSNADIANQIAIVNNLGNDGYLLLWNILKMTIPAFDNQKSHPEPDWHQYKDIARFATAYTTFHRFERLRGRALTDKEKTFKFLSGIKEVAYSGVLATLRIQIQAHIPDPCDAPGSLPTALQIGSLAVTIKDQMEGMVIDSDLDLHRRVNLIIRNNARVNATYGFSHDTSDSDDDPTTFELPGIDPVVRAARDDRQPRDARRPVRRHDRSSSDNPDTPFRRPRRAFDKNSTCGACKMVGHLDADCFHLARAIFIAKYMKNPRNVDKCKKLAEKIESVWSKQHSTRSDGRVINSAAVLQAYRDDHNLTLDQMEFIMGPDPDSLWMDPVTDPTSDM